MKGPQNLSVNGPHTCPPKHIDELSCVSLMSKYTTAIRSLYHHVVCNGPTSCKFNGTGNKLEEFGRGIFQA